MTNKSYRSRRGFTLIELLVVISIIALLSSIVITSVNTARSKARDSQRRQTIIQLRTALELYYSKHGSYPTTGYNTYNSDPDIQNNFTNTNGGNWIPGLVADGNISALPHDPAPGTPITGCDSDSQWWGNPESAEFIYQSLSGEGYALASICGAENAINTKDPMYDSYLATQGFSDLHTMKICNDTSAINKIDANNIALECQGGANGWF